MMIMAMVISFLISSELSDRAEIVVQGEWKASAKTHIWAKKNYSTNTDLGKIYFQQEIILGDIDRDEMIGKKY